MISRPLADRMRPTEFYQMVGNRSLFGKDGILQKITDSGKIPNIIMYGPPGTGKTTAAGIIASKADMALVRLNATTASLSDVREATEQTHTLEGTRGILLYLDEIQYFNKKQQQSLLEFMEDGRITLIASTTENPYFYVYNAVISRSVVFEFKSIDEMDFLPLIDRAVEFMSKESGKEISITEDAARIIARAGAGDARRVLNIFENACSYSDGIITEEAVKAFTPEIVGLGGFDKAGDGHYDLLSAYQKSIRGSDPDAAIFYLAKILAGGDLISVMRRIQVIASEDIGLAYPQAASITHACVESARQLGLPEAAIPLANATILLATSPKSNSANEALKKAMQDIADGKGIEPPRQLQNTHFDGMNSSEKGQNYKYPHNYKNHYVKQQYLPDDIKDSRYYEFGDNKLEQAAKNYWDLIKKGI